MNSIALPNIAASGLAQRIFHILQREGILKKAAVQYKDVTIAVIRTQITRWFSPLQQPNEQGTTTLGRDDLRVSVKRVADALRREAAEVFTLSPMQVAEKMRCIAYNLDEALYMTEGPAMQITILRAARDLPYLKEHYPDHCDALDTIAAELEARAQG